MVDYHVFGSLIWCAVEDRERGNILEGLMDDDEEDEDGEEPQYAMTDEWAKFFATSEARRRESALHFWSSFQFLLLNLLVL